MMGMSDFNAYKDTNHKCTKKDTIRSKARQVVTNSNVDKFLKEIEKIKLSEKIMSRKERMECLSILGRGNLSYLVNFNHCLLYTSDAADE